jgi:hypothetical protein
MFELVGLHPILTLFIISILADVVFLFWKRNRSFRRTDMARSEPNRTRFLMRYTKGIRFIKGHVHYHLLIALLAVFLFDVLFFGLLEKWPETPLLTGTFSASQVSFFNMHAEESRVATSCRSYIVKTTLPKDSRVSLSRPSTGRGISGGERTGSRQA